jgi:ribonuclease D
MSPTGPRRRAGKPIVAESPTFDWISQSADFEKLIDECLGHEAYAIDTEFLRERTYYPNLALVQIKVGEQTALIDPIAISMDPLKRLFESDSIAVFHAADQDLEVLELACGTIPKRMFDTQLAAGFLGFSTPSLLNLVERVLGVKLSKGDRLTDWTVRPLTEAQCSYAASDVTHLLELRDKLLTELSSAGRVEWVETETEVLRTRPRGQHDPTRAWWRLKDGRVLRGQDRLVAQELCAWRELRAQKEDRPVRFVMADLAVVAISQAKPTNAVALSGIRGVDGRVAKSSVAQEILSIVSRAGQMDISELNVPEAEDFDRRLRPALTLVSAWISQLAQDARIDQSIMATRTDLVDFLRHDESARLNDGWRAGLLGENIGKLVSGGAALAFDTSGTLVLEHRSNDPIPLAVSVPDAEWTAPVEEAPAS